MTLPARTCGECGKPLNPRTDAKTDLCRHCWSIRGLQQHQRRLSPQQKADANRRRYLPGQLEAARRKVVMLEREAKRLGIEVAG